MNPPEMPVPRGTEILTHATLGDAHGMLVDPENLARRHANARGTIRGPVAGHYAKVYWVDHGDAHAPLAAYDVEEFEIVAAVPGPVESNSTPDTPRGEPVVSGTLRRLLKWAS